MNVSTPSRHSLVEVFCLTFRSPDSDFFRPLYRLMMIFFALATVAALYWVVYSIREILFPPFVCNGVGQCFYNRPDAGGIELGLLGLTPPILYALWIYFRAFAKNRVVRAIGTTLTAASMATIAVGFLFLVLVWLFLGLLIVVFILLLLLFWPSFLF